MERVDSRDGDSKEHIGDIRILSYPTVYYSAVIPSDSELNSIKYTTKSVSAVTLE
jgi:hypothetical protein